MKRTSKLGVNVGFVALLALALTATLGVTSASARILQIKTNAEKKEIKFTAEYYPAEVSASYPSVRFETPKGVVSCTGKGGVGEAASEAANTVLVSTGFSGCSAFGFTSSVKTNGCYQWYHVTEEWKPFTPFKGYGGLGCPPGTAGLEISPMVFGQKVCTMTLLDQPAGTVEYTLGSVQVFDTTHNAFSYSISSGGLNPGACGGVGSHTDGTYSLEAALSVN